MLTLLIDIDQLKAQLDSVRHLDNYRIRQALELEYTYESNRIEGNTLTLRETDLVINEGLTIGGKPLKDHLEAINHRDAVDYVRDIVQQRLNFSERVLLDLHSLILRGIDRDNAGRYRSVPVLIGGSRYVPPQPYLVLVQMEALFRWYQDEATELHPVMLAAELHERIVTIHPFIDGNGRTARLVMNLTLSSTWLPSGYPKRRCRQSADVLQHLRDSSDNRRQGGFYSVSCRYSSGYPGAVTAHTSTLKNGSLLSPDSTLIPHSTIPRKVRAFHTAWPPMSLLK